MTSWNSENYCSNSDVIIPYIDFYVVKSQLVEQNEPFLKHRTECICPWFYFLFPQKLSFLTDTSHITIFETADPEKSFLKFGMTID